MVIGSLFVFNVLVIFVESGLVFLDIHGLKIFG